jgi:hypothetical protein
MKKFFFSFVLMIGLLACSTGPPVDDTIMHLSETTLLSGHSENMDIICTAVLDAPNTGYSKIYQASVLGGLLGDNLDIIAMVLLLFTTIFGGLWIKVRSKIKQIGELFLAAYEYTDDKKLDKEEREDLKRKFLEIISKTPT